MKPRIKENFSHFVPDSALDLVTNHFELPNELHSLKPKLICKGCLDTTSDE